MSYVLVEWPWSQEFMDEDWFEEEAVCAVGAEDRFGSAAYFIPSHRVKNSPDTLLQRAYELLDSGKVVLEEATPEDEKNLNQLKRDIRDYLI